jgi:hypothetical protein
MVCHSVFLCCESEGQSMTCTGFMTGLRCTLGKPEGMVGTYVSGYECRLLCVLEDSKVADLREWQWLPTVILSQLYVTLHYVLAIIV